MNIKNLFKNIFTILVATIIALVLCEIVLRVTGISYPVFHKYDELRGRALRPYKEGWFHNEGKAYVRINSFGYRDVEHSINKPPGTFRIAVLGDSFTFARQVALEDTFWSYLGKNLNTCTKLAGQKIEVLNFGVGGYSTTQELLTLQKDVWQFNPDLVLLAVFTGNDIAGNSKELGAKEDKIRPYHVFENGKMVLDNSFRLGRGSFWKNLKYEAVHYSRLLEFINQAKHAWKSKPQKSYSNLKENINLGFTLSPDVYLPPKTATWKEAWLITEKLFALINQEVKEHGAKFVLTVLTNEKQVHPDSTVREKFKTKFGIENLLYPELRISSIGEKYGFPVITMAERFRQVVTQEGIFLHGFKNTSMGVGHWNENGHRLAGKILVENICEKVLTPSLELTK